MKYQTLDPMELLGDTIDEEHGSDMESVMDRLTSMPATIHAPEDGHPKLAGGLNIKFLPHRDGIPMPEYKSALASGIDINAANFEPITLNRMGSLVKVPTGICLEIPPGYEVQIRPRSGLAANHGITVTNTPGTIDADYRGEIVVLLTNLSTNRFTIERGMRIAQMVIVPVIQADLHVVEDLESTVRGDGAFGSTGVE